MKHSSVNGLVDEQTVQEMYEMIVENSRRFLDTPSSTDAKALQAMGNIVLRYRRKVFIRYLWTTGVMGVDRLIIGLRIVHGNKPKTHRSRELSFLKVDVSHRIY